MKTFVCSLAVLIRAETFEEAAAIFDADIKDPHAEWYFRITDKDSGDSRRIDSAVAEEHYPEG